MYWLDIAYVFALVWSLLNPLSEVLSSSCPAFPLRDLSGVYFCRGMLFSLLNFISGDCLALKRVVQCESRLRVRVVISSFLFL